VEAYWALKLESISSTGKRHVDDTLSIPSPNIEVTRRQIEGGILWRGFQCVSPHIRCQTAYFFTLVAISCWWFPGCHFKFFVIAKNAGGVSFAPTYLAWRLSEGGVWDFLPTLAWPYKQARLLETSGSPNFITFIFAACHSLMRSFYWWQSLFELLPVSVRCLQLSNLLLLFKLAFQRTLLFP